MPRTCRHQRRHSRGPRQQRDHERDRPHLKDEVHVGDVAHRVQAQPADLVTRQRGQRSDAHRHGKADTKGEERTPREGLQLLDDVVGAFPGDVGGDLVARRNESGAGMNQEVGDTASWRSASSTSSRRSSGAITLKCSTAARYPGRRRNVGTSHTCRRKSRRRLRRRSRRFECGVVWRQHRRIRRDDPQPTMSSVCGSANG